MAQSENRWVVNMTAGILHPFGLVYLSVMSCTYFADLESVLSSCVKVIIIGMSPVLILAPPGPRNVCVGLKSYGL